MTHEHTFPNEEPLAGGNSFQNALRQAAGHMIAAVEEKPSLTPDEFNERHAVNLYGNDSDYKPFPDARELRAELLCVQGLNPFTHHGPHDRLAMFAGAVQENPPAAFSGVITPSTSSQDFTMTSTVTATPIAQEPVAASVEQAIPEYVVEAVQSLHSAPPADEQPPADFNSGYKVTDLFGGSGVICKVAESNNMDEELAGLNERSHAPSPARVDLTRSQRNEQRKAVNQQQSEGNRRERQPRPVRNPAPARAAVPVKVQPLMQSEKSRNYLRQAMQSAVTNEDGVDHLNTSSSAVTRLGQALEINAHIPFHHPDLGPFKSVGGLWYFIGGQTQDEQFRSLFGKACRMQGKAIKMREIQGFKTIIAEATWIKVFSDDGLRQAMVDSALPFRCYYLQGDMNLRVAALTEDWYMPILEEIRRTLKVMDKTGQTDLFPDFAFLESRRQIEKKNAAPKTPQSQRVQHQRY